MEQKENVMDNDFENFEDVAKYTSIGDYYGKQADSSARIAVVFLGLAAFLFMGVGYVLSVLENNGLISVEIDWLYGLIVGLSIIFCFVSSVFAVMGYRVKKRSCRN